MGRCLESIEKYREDAHMAVAVIMPRQGNTVESCIITEWKKKPGDTVAVGDVLFAYETDKAAFECEADTAGTLLKVFFDIFAGCFTLHQFMRW